MIAQHANNHFRCDQPFSKLTLSALALDQGGMHKYFLITGSF